MFKFGTCLGNTLITHIHQYKTKKNTIGFTLKSLKSQFCKESHEWNLKVCVFLFSVLKKKLFSLLTKQSVYLSLVHSVRAIEHSLLICLSWKHITAYLLILFLTYVRSRGKKMREPKPSYGNISIGLIPKQNFDFHGWISCFFFAWCFFWFFSLAKCRFAEYIIIERFNGIRVWTFN